MNTAPMLPRSNLDAAMSHIDAFLAVSPSVQTAPGLSLAITDREGLLAVRHAGFADVEAKRPVDDDILFEFGSIGKPFTATCLLQLAEEGAVDLHAPVTAYLPWFAVRSSYEPITLHHLLSHTSGLVCGSDFPDSRYEVWALRETEVAAPGIRARYSNVAYKTLGFVLEAVTGTPYRRLVAERILTPLGMGQSVGAITHAVRPRLAVGYAGQFPDRPWRPAYGFMPATWLETNTGDGCLAGTAADLAAYLRMLLNGGRGPRGRVLSDAGFALMTTPHGTFSSGGVYGYGLSLGETNGRRRIGHEGGMVGFSASMLGDPDAGIGVVVLVNALQETEDLAEFALQTVVNASLGEPFPQAETPPVIDFAGYAGVYRDGDETFTIDVDAGQLVLRRGNQHIALEPLGVPPDPDQFLAQDPALALVPFRFQRDDDGRVEGLVHGEHWYPAAGYEGPTDLVTPPAWSAYPGHYRSHNPWHPGFRVVLRQGALRLIYPWGEETLLHPHGDGFHSRDEPEGPEFFVFDTVVDGQAQRVRSPGGERFYRFFTP